MVTTEIPQLSGECNVWRETLRSLREEFAGLKNQLPSIAGQETNKEILLEIDHLDNQLHIQLINIHDLKHSVKQHDRKLQQAMNSGQGTIPEELLEEHETLNNDYEDLCEKLEELRSEFDQFLAHTH